MRAFSTAEKLRVLGTRKRRNTCYQLFSCVMLELVLGRDLTNGYNFPTDHLALFNYTGLWTKMENATGR